MLEPKIGGFYGNIFMKPKKKRESLSPSVKLKLWETLPHTCHVCHKRIPSFDAAELDHVRAFSKGGKKMRWAHRSCNRLKSKKGLTAAQKMLGTYKPKKRKASRKSGMGHKKGHIPSDYFSLGVMNPQPKIKWRF
ncbi:MAG: hypothetical protein WC506_00750 [Candidatus Micrarchaeia archaeon]